MNEVTITMKVISFIIKHRIKQCKCFVGLHDWDDWDYIEHPGATEERQCKVRGCDAKQKRPHLITTNE